MGSLPCTQGRRSPLPYSSLQRANVIKRNPNYFSPLQRLSYLHHFFGEMKTDTQLAPAPPEVPVPQSPPSCQARVSIQRDGVQPNGNTCAQKAAPKLAVYPVPTEPRVSTLFVVIIPLIKGPVFSSGCKIDAGCYGKHTLFPFSRIIDSFV